MNNYFLFWWHIRVSKSITHFNKMLPRAPSLRAHGWVRAPEPFAGDESGALKIYYPIVCEILPGNQTGFR